MWAFAEGTSAPLKQSRLNTQLSQCHAWLGATQYSAACQTPRHGRSTLSWTVGGRRAGKGQARSDEERRMGGSEGGWGKKGGIKRREGGTEGGRE